MNIWVGLLCGFMLLFIQPAPAQEMAISSYNDFLALKEAGITSVSESLISEGWSVEGQGEEIQDKSSIRPLFKKADA